jgi:hypothetical protein
MTPFTWSRISRSAFLGLVLTTLVAIAPGCTEEKQPEPPKAQKQECVGLGACPTLTVAPSCQELRVHL